MSKRNLVLLTGAVFTLLILFVMVFTVRVTEYTVVLQFGNPVRAITEPGLYMKWPDPIQTTKTFDNRLKILNLDKREYLTNDKKNILLDNFVTWRISDPVTFLRTLQTQRGAEDKLADIAASELGVALGQFSLLNLINVDPEQMRLGEMNRQITTEVEKRVQAYGIKVESFGTKLLNFPDTNQQSVFRRMEAERKRQARKYRAEGNEEAAKVRAQANMQREIILSESTKTAETLKGEGEAEAIRIYAQAFNQDPEFYRFTRSLKAYEKFIDSKTTVILNKDSKLLEYFENYAPQTPALRATAAAKDKAPMGDLRRLEDGN